jgi:hypothetical protein
MCKACEQAVYEPGTTMGKAPQVVHDRQDRVGTSCSQNWTSTLLQTHGDHTIFPKDLCRFSSVGGLVIPTIHIANNKYNKYILKKGIL